MTTPNKEQILELAKELYFNDMAKSGIQNFNTPEPNELAENGYIQTARSILMRSEDSEYKSHVEREARELGLIEDNSEGFSHFQFDTTEAMQTTTFINGSRGVGKSDVAMQAVDKLTSEGIVSVVFDSSLDWQKRSSITQYVTAKANADLQIPRENIIIDMSMLAPSEQQRTVEHFCEKLFQHQVETKCRIRFYLVFEESQIFFPLNSLRSKKTQNSMKILTVGRNLGISVCSVSQFPALVDKELVKHAGQIFIGYTSEPNTLSYWKGILGENARQLKELQNGQFLYYCRNKLSKIQIESYENYTPKTQIEIPQVSVEPLALQKPRRSLGGAVAALVWLLIILAILLGGLR